MAESKKYKKKRDRFIFSHCIIFPPLTIRKGQDLVLGGQDLGLKEISIYSISKPSKILMAHF